MRIDIISIFPEAFDSYFRVSILKRARERKLLDIRIHNLRDFATDSRRTVDAPPYGGGPGMVFKIEPLAKVFRALTRRITNQEGKRKTGVILFTPSGKQFDQKTARAWAQQYRRLILICGHYEGVDERVKRVIYDAGFNVQEISIGPYVLTGGELPALVVADAVARHIPGVLGKRESLEEERYGVGLPVYTRPEVFTWRGKRYAIPPILRSGDHQKIHAWRQKHRK